MTRRQQHNIESNCVSFDDDCFNETANPNPTPRENNLQDEIWFKRTGQKFVEYLNHILKGN